MNHKMKSCFVMMPSGNHNEYKGGKEESDFIYTGIIVPALQKVFGEDIEVIRETDNRNPGAITRELVKHIALSDLCIVDVTGQNPNVFLELGIRYGLRKSTTVLLKQPDTVIPFDITTYRCVEYTPLYNGPQRAINDISETISLICSQHKIPSDSLVFDVFPRLVVEIPGLISESGEESTSSRTMTWNEYWERLQHVVARLRDNFQDGRYVPDVILGISNGGLMYADLLGRELFRGIPILALWADRLNKEGRYFDNVINDAMVQSVNCCIPKAKEQIEILLVDDIVASGTTVSQAFRFLESKFSNSRISYLPLFSRNQQYFDLIKDHIVWLSPIFHISEEEATSMHKVEKPLLPYGKEIRST